AARSFGLEPIPTPARNDAEVEAFVEALGHDRDGVVVAMRDGFTLVHRAPIILQTARNKVPAVYWNSIMARDGGLLSYGPDTGDIFRRAALSLIASSVVQSRPSYRFSCRPNFKWLSISKLPRRLASRSRRRS